MQRGDFVTIALSGDFGKPRPALIVQADRFEDTATVTVPLVSGTLVEAPLLRVTVQPSLRNGLQKRSEVMIDKAMTVRRERIGRTLGQIDSESLIEIERRLAVFLGIAK